MTISLNWVKQTGRYARGEDLLVGEWIVGCISHDVVNNPDGEMCVYCHLPGKKKRLRNRHSTAEAKAVLERAVMDWFARAMPPAYLTVRQS